MAIITAITAQKDKNRVNLFLDGEFALGLTQFALLASGLKTGQEITEERLREVAERSERDSALSKAMKYLSLKPVTIKRMDEYLADKGFDEAVREQVVARLVELKMLDDAAYAQLYVRCYRTKQGNGLMRHKLRELGVDGAIVAAVLEDSDEAEAAREVALKYLRTHKSDRKKLYAYLYNKGFGADACKTVLPLADNDED